eukprot:CAMPEP_0182829320 /NCGR_PEP_ID=MMETSP0006_2-20121128/17963_1 /TAXON_ID=97485 /ORGANISM="Prymnesium parvum, Strain Texoma1" /LENGTH=54 /DNA_ID=CAMNT_0024956781 /DNA_START=204 /DNA_END=368 /DNA_ORIENTATION=-
MAALRPAVSEKGVSGVSGCGLVGRGRRQLLQRLRGGSMRTADPGAGGGEGPGLG